MNFFQYSIQFQLDKELISIVKKLKKFANAKKEEYSTYKIPVTYNSTNITEYDNETQVAIFLNTTGISHLRQSVTNQRSIGIRQEYIDKYLDSIAKRFEFSEEVKEFFKPMFINITEKNDDSWKNYELMYKKKSTNNTLFICILVKNCYDIKKLDFIITQVELEYQFSNFMLIEVNSFNKMGVAETNFKIVKTDIEKSVNENELEVAHSLLASTGYDSLIDFLQIKDEDSLENKKSLIFLK